MLEYFTIFILPNLSRTGKKTMKIAQRSHFDRSCRSVHVTRACKQAPLAQLSWQRAERNFPGYSNQIPQVAETTLSQWTQRALLCKF